MATSRGKTKTIIQGSGAWRKEIEQYWITSGRTNLPAFIQIASNFSWIPADHLLLLCEYLQKVERGEIKRLRVTMPPRHGKSMVVSQYFPAWYLGRNPDCSVIIASYAADLAYDFSRVVREVLRQNGKLFFGVNISEESSAVDRWGLKGRQGALMAAGVGGPLTGRGASLIIIDDPLKGRETANSLVMRNHLWDWYTSTAYTRLTPDGAIILVETRWHEDDLFGRLDDRSREDWVTINLPAIAEEGDALGRNLGDPLWPDRFSKDRITAIEREIGPYDFASLYQQRPIPREGGMFKREWFEIVQGFPHAGRTVRRWDFAASEDTGDWTVGLLLTVHDGIGYIRDVRRLQGSPGQVEALAHQTAIMDSTDVMIRWEQEPGSSGKFVSDQLIRRVFFGYNAKGIPSTGSKVDRAQPASSMAEAGNLKIVKGNWNEAFLSEIEMFPYGKNDDQVDALSGAIQDLATGGKKTPRKYAGGHHRSPF